MPLTIASLLWISTAHLSVEKIVGVQKVLQVLHRELSQFIECLGQFMSWTKFYEALDVSHFMEVVIFLLWSRWASDGGGEWSLSLHGGHTEQKAVRYLSARFICANKIIVSWIVDLVKVVQAVWNHFQVAPLLSRPCSLHKLKGITYVVTCIHFDMDLGSIILFMNHALKIP